LGIGTVGIATAIVRTIIDGMAITVPIIDGMATTDHTTDLMPMGTAIPTIIGPTTTVQALASGLASEPP
jgi:hypothetical protein